MLNINDGGTYHGMMRQFGFDEDFAKMIETAYHELYKVSDSWVQDKVKQACDDGYVTGAFGLRIRTPLLAQVVYGSSSMPNQAKAESRTAGNALGQSWCLLNCFSANNFREEYINDPVMKYNIRPCMQIHDAQYYIIKTDIETIHYVNTKLPKHTLWQDHPDIYHPVVGLGGELSVFYPHWGNDITLKNFISKEEIVNKINTNLMEYNEKTK